MKNDFKILVEFVGLDGRFRSMYHYLNIYDALNDMLYGDLKQLVDNPNIDVFISKGSFKSFCG